MKNKKSSPFPFGATLYDDGCNFSIHSPDNIVSLIIFTDSENQEYKLKTHDQIVYYTFIPNITSGTQYGFKTIDNDGHSRLLLDPYSHSLSKPLQYNSPLDTEQSWTLSKSTVVDHNFDWENDTAPNHPIEKTILFELHIKGFTQQCPHIAPQYQGKYLGLCQPDIIQFFKQQNITTLQLLPITSFVTESHLKENNLTNFWGYNSVCFMAPHPNYAEKDAVNELKHMVRELHKNDIEVILDVVFNHTAEGDHNGPCFHLKALDQNYYLHNNPQQYMNYTGCGNTLDLTHQASFTLVLDTLRHWVNEYHIDGFRFDLATTLGRDHENFSPHSGFFMAIAQDPILQKVKLIAEPWDIGPNGYQLGNYPDNWHECNDKFRDITKSYWLQQPNFAKNFATQLMGSRDIFSASRWPQKLPVNFISYHDGFTLQDLVSYNDKHNEANGENNRDGHSDNRSNNHGVEGDTNNTAIILLRDKQKRNLMISLLFSFGIPHLLAVDSLSHSQQGNNNAYCQDNPISWADWNLSHINDVFKQWLADIIAIRQQIMPDVIRAFSNENRNKNKITWSNANGTQITPAQWLNIDHFSLHIDLFNHDGELLYLINATDTSLTFNLPKSTKWSMVCDTSTQNIIVKDVNVSYIQHPHSLSVLYRAN
ncbi:glycogen debranching protein GlgX [Photobacterium kishitanii]|uniref:glycogen debranching protein GlgX n=1 Tax=Photobacterium kishitanii TaxID=318456 RepID=UPI00071AED34|nr:glycogen debranching protein GlgX [Photobacterium kishitanii]